MVHRMPSSLSSGQTGSTHNRYRYHRTHRCCRWVKLSCSDIVVRLLAPHFLRPLPFGCLHDLAHLQRRLRSRGVHY